MQSTCRGYAAVSDAIPLSAHHGKRRVQALLEEALDLLFVKKGRGHIERV